MKRVSTLVRSFRSRAVSSVGVICCTFCRSDITSSSSVIVSVSSMSADTGRTVVLYNEATDYSISYNGHLLTVFRVK